jgi:hypothetical protein
VLQVRWVVVLGFSAFSVWGQCPNPNFLQAPEISLIDRGVSVAGIQRQADGSYSRQRFQYQSPFTKIDATANIQSALVSCTAASPRTFQPPVNWHPFAELPGVSSKSNIVSDLLGRGTPAALGNGAQVMLTLNISFKPAFAGHRGVWLAAQTLGGAQTSDWQALGNWSVPGN